jgi:8-hydroxy-5-deazaflavin:NADPH oxidoreductase
MKIAIVGGTGKEGGGLARRWQRAGHEVAIGSRDADRARARAAELGVSGMGNLEAAQFGEIVVLAVPYAAHEETLRAILPALPGKVLLDITVPLKPPKVSRVQLPPGRAAALEAQALVGAEIPVAAALHHVSHTWLADADSEAHCDVLCVADDAWAKEVTLKLVGDLGLRALDAGPLDNAVALESLTPVLIHLNKTYKSAGAGIVFTGLGPSPG